MLHSSGSFTFTEPLSRFELGRVRVPEALSQACTRLRNLVIPGPYRHDG